jgi:tRNA modification GTPase
MADTIFAPASGPGRGAVAVIRISGPQAAAIVRAMTGAPVPAARRAGLRTLRHPADGEALDRGLVLWFPAPHSATGEDVAELHVHGGRAVIASVCEGVAAAGGRPAEPGEFTRRGFHNGRMDLTAAEAVADLVDAQTRAQQRQALRQMSGALGRTYEGWRGRLVAALAHLEADLDFPDEDLPEGVAGAVRPVLADLGTAIRVHLADNRRGERLREGIHVAILGPPNAGKSSLLNALAQRDAAIVSERAGTTRDVIEVQADLGGFPVVLIDTAGLRAARDEIEAEGVRRAEARAAAADVKLLLFDAETWPGLDAATLALADADALVVLNKADRCRPPAEAAVDGAPVLALSALTGEGVPALLEVLTDRVADRFGAAEAPALTRARHRSALEDCVAALDRAGTAPLPELMAEDVRLAARALGRITGTVDVEDVLDVVFRDFCIGK